MEKAIIYGSRAKGNFKPGSDVDLTIVGQDLSLAELLKIDAAIDELLLPYKFDLSLYSSIDSRGLLDHIKHVGQIFYEKVPGDKLSPRLLAIRPAE